MKNDPAGIRKRQKEVEKELLQGLNEIYLTYSWREIWQESIEYINKNRDRIEDNLKRQLLFTIHQKIDDLLKKTYRDGVYWLYKAYSSAIDVDVPVPVKDRTPYISPEMAAALTVSYKLIDDYSQYLIQKIIEDKLISNVNDFDVESRAKESMEGLTRLIARTETHRQKVHGAVDAAETVGLKSLQVVDEAPIEEGEFITAGDSKVCARCRSLAGKILELSQIKDLIPVHRYCRCWFRLSEQLL